MCRLSVLILILSAFHSVTNSVSAQSLFEMVTKKMADPQRDIFVGSIDKETEFEKSENEYSDFVSAGQIWDDDRMMKMLGLEEEREDIEDLKINQEEDSYDGNGPSSLTDTEVPSLLSALYDKMNSPGSTVVPIKCRLPGMKGNVVRMLNNKGNLLYQSQRQSVFELRFSFKHALHEYENITQAELQVSPPYIANELNEELAGWLIKNGLISSPQYKYEVYFANDEKWFKIKKKLVEIMAETKNDVNDILKQEQYLTHERDMSSALGTPIVTKYYSPNLMKTQLNKIPINVKILVEKWRKIYYKSQRRAISRAFLVVTMEIASSVKKQCTLLLVGRPRLLLVSFDRRQCPLPMTSYVDKEYDDNDVTEMNDVTIERRKRSLDDERNSGRSRKVKENKKKFARTSSNKKKSARTPDLVQGASLHTSQSRSIRSTICRKYPMYVGFHDVGWGQWIIAPRGYHAYRCAGECPFPLGGRLNGTNHAILLTMMHSVEPWNSPTPCCVPTVLSPISLLYFDTSGNVVLRQYEDMVVNACGCR